MLKYWKHLAAAFLACLVFMLLAQPAAAVGGQQGAFTYELKGNGTAVITKFDWDKHTGGDVYVPRSIDGYQVTTIGKLAFTSQTDERHCVASLLQKSGARQQLHNDLLISKYAPATHHRRGLFHPIVLIYSYPVVPRPTPSPAPMQAHQQSLQ